MNEKQKKIQMKGLRAIVYLIPIYLAFGMKNILFGIWNYEPAFMLNSKGGRYENKQLL
ncbi:hypothetical protein [Schaedlerella arabinosiphila]|uniref:hypothetical protein n=1 Tax=Schaedlerella arabinosiphila TaxID=2044587 RepID=UPI0012B6A3DC|nr:hypothetical protein [Schaedlerella arabinosiphila]